MHNQVGRTPGPQPREGPTSATGYSDFIGGSRMEQSTATGTNQLRIAHWNAEGVRNKKIDLQNFLRANGIDICCLQETHLTQNHRFSVRGYETYRHDREGRLKGGVVTLVKNSLPSVLLKKSKPGEDTEYIGIQLVTRQKEPLTLYNVYSPPDKLINLDEVEATDNNWMIVGDFNSHSPNGGYEDLDQKGYLQQLATSK